MVKEYFCKGLLILKYIKKKRKRNFLQGNERRVYFLFYMEIKT